MHDETVSGLMNISTDKCYNLGMVEDQTSATGYTSPGTGCWPDPPPCPACGHSPCLGHVQWVSLQKFWQACPVCKGSGLDPFTGASTTVTPQCRHCHGARVIETPRS